MTRFDNVSFTNYADHRHPARGQQYRGRRPAHPQQPELRRHPTTGVYLSATDTDGATSGVLTLNLVNPSPGTPSGFVNASNGAVINWPAVAPGITWTGAAGTDWNTGGNWSGGQVPTASDDVTIPAGGRPVLSANASARNLTVQAGALVDLNSFDLFVSGSLAASASPSFIPGAGGRLRLVGTGQTVAGDIGSAIEILVEGSYSLTGPISVRDLNVVTSGTLTVNGHSITMANAMFISGSGARLIMTNPADVVSVATSAFFDGAASGGSLAAGRLEVTGK